MEAETKASRAEAINSEMLEALITAQAMEDAVRAIIKPLQDVSEAFSIMSAVEACLDKMASKVDPAIEVAHLREAHHG